MGNNSLTSKVWAAIRWARLLGMPILIAPSAKASENMHTYNSSMRSRGPMSIFHLGKVEYTCNAGWLKQENHKFKPNLGKLAT